MMIVFAVGEWLVVALMGGPEAVPDWVSLLNTLALFAAVAGGALAAWRVHGHRLSGRVLLDMLVGGAIGAAAIALLVLVLQGIRILLAGVLPRQEAPWDLVALVVLGTLAFLAVPVYAAIKDLARSRDHPVRDWLRLAALLVLLIGVAVTLIIGGETAEAGIFAVMFGAVAAFAVAGGSVSLRAAGPTARP